MLWISVPSQEDTGPPALHLLAGDYRLEHDFEDIGRRIMLVTARPLLHDDNIECILLAITDVTEWERSLFELAAQKEYSEKVDATRDPLLVLDWNMRARTANASFYDTFGISPEDMEGRLVYELGNGQWDFPRLRELLENVLPENNAFDDFEVEHDFAQIATAS